MRQFGQRHRAGFVQRDAPQFRRAGGLGQARAVAVRADVLLQEFLHPLHALLVLDLGEGIFHGVDGVKIGKVQLASRWMEFLACKNVLFLRRAVKTMSFSRSVSSRKGTSVRTPIARQTSVISDHIRLFHGRRATSSMLSDSVRHQRGQVHRAHGARAAAFLAGALELKASSSADGA